jgi:acetamidase/formamidase
MGLNADLDLAMKQALRKMIFTCGRTGWTPARAYKRCYLAVDFKVTQNVNGEKGVHGMHQHSSELLRADVVSGAEVANS